MFLTTLGFLVTASGWEPTLGFPALPAMPGRATLISVIHAIRR
jgi:hypothetical protein